MHTTSRRGGLAGRGAAWKTCLLMTIGLCALLLTMPAAPGAVTVTNSTSGAVDGDFFTPTFVVSGASAITDVDILIDFSKCDGPPPGPTETRCFSQGSAFSDQIVFILTSPSGTPVTLLTVATYDDVEAPGARVSVTFDDEAVSPVGGGLQSGRFQPVGQPTGPVGLTAFDGQNPNGTWTLRIEDTANDGNPLQFYSATLCINQACPSITSLKIGDVDSDDDRDGVDARLLLGVLVGSNPPEAIHFLAAGDVNADSVIDNRDSSLILAIVAGRIPPPPNPNSIEALDTFQGIVVISGSPDAAHANRTFNLSNPANGDTTPITADPDGSFGDGEGAVTLDGVGGNTIIADIEDSPARAAILVQVPFFFVGEPTTLLGPTH